MLPRMCSQPPCMNMLVKIVSQMGDGPGASSISTFSSPIVITSGFTMSTLWVIS